MLFKKLSFQKKLYISCFILNLVLLSICSVVFYYYTSDSLKKNMQDTVISNTSMLSKDLDNLLRAADSTLKELQTNSSLTSVAKEITYSRNNYFATHVPDSSTFQKAFRSVLFSQNLNGSISYVSNHYDNIGASYSTGTYEYISKEKLRKLDGLTDLLENTNFVSYIPPHEDYWGHGKTVFSVVRSMRDTYHKYGIFILDFDISALSALLKDFENPEDFSITILDKEQNFVYTSDADMNQEHFYNCYKEAVSSGTDRTFSANDVSISCYDVSSTTGWTFILTSSTAGYLKSLRNALAVSAILFLSLFFIMSSFLFLMTHKLTKPLKQLTNQLMNLEPGRNININQISSNNEITTLTNAVQAFLSEIYDQNRRLTEARRRTLKAHYDAMEAQLNPHFLYNTLAVIGMAGLSSGNMTVSTMCSELANLLRYSLSYTGQAVLLEQEITNANSYLYIMKMRYEDDLIYEWNLDESLNSISVPKLILQPLIENCFQHGFQQTEYEILPPWTIRITSFRDDTYWYLSITNNGAPFRKEKLAQLKERLQAFKEPEYDEKEFEDLIKRQGFGLENTILRLNIYYHGEEYFDVYTDERNEETTVTIGGPVMPQNTFDRF